MFGVAFVMSNRNNPVVCDVNILLAFIQLKEKKSVGDNVHTSQVLVQ